VNAGRRLLPLVALGAAAAVVGVVLAATSSRGKAIDVPSAHAASWGKAIEVPGTAALNSGGHAGVDSLSCTSVGNCAARGDYRVGTTFRAFVANENDGVWGPAMPTNDRNTASQKAFDALQRAHLSRIRHLSDGFGGVSDLVCTKPGFCVAGGSYYDGRSGCGVDGGYCYQAFVVNETNGVWGRAVEVPGTAKLNSAGDGSFDTISCWSTGNCTGMGTFMRGPAALEDETFAVEERNGVWGNAMRFPFPTDMLSADGGFGFTDLFCDSARSCAATGSAPSVSVFVVNKTNGTWGKPIPVPGLDRLEQGANDAAMRSLFCTTSRFCTAGGESSVGYDPDGTHTDIEPFLVTEKNGVWGDAFALPGFTDLNEGEFSDLFSISCPTATSCAAGGMYTDDSHRQQGFVVSETNGVWGEAIEVPGSAALSVGHNENGSDAEVDQVVCATADSCTAGGFYTDRAGHQQAFVTAP